MEKQVFKRKLEERVNRWNWLKINEWASGLVGASVATLAWLTVVVILLTLPVPLWLVVPLVALRLGRSFGVVATQLRDASQQRLNISPAITSGAWGGAAFGVAMFSAQQWAVASGFEAWLQTQNAWWAYWHWF